MNINILSECIVGIAALYVPIKYFAQVKRENVGVKDTGKYSQKINELLKISSQFFEKTSLLENHAVNYFNSLQEVGLGTVINIRDELTRATKDCQKLFSEGRFEDSFELAKFLTTPFSKCYPGISRLTEADLVILEDWRQRGDQLILSCVIRLGVMASKNESAGVKRVEKRRATIHTLDELKRILSDYRPNAD